MGSTNEQTDVVNETAPDRALEALVLKAIEGDEEAMQQCRLAFQDPVVGPQISEIFLAVVRQVTGQLRSLQEELELKPGISAKAEVFIEEKEDILFVPLQCVFLEEGMHFCYILGETGEPERIEVKPGSSNDSFLEILEGLEEDE